MSYLMETPGEGARLLAQGVVTPLLARLTLAGLQAGASVLDVGCGAGAGALAVVPALGPSGRYLGVDPSEARLAQARLAVGGEPRARFERAALPALGLAPAAFDFVFSQFVFEYLGDPEVPLRELLRVAKPGGRVAVVDVDRFGVDYWPREPELAEGEGRFLEAAGSRGFDGEVGRKLFWHFRRAGLVDVRVEHSLQYLVAGAAGEQLVADWALRFEALADLVAPRFGSRQAYDAYAHRYLKMLADPDTLKLQHVLTTSGTCP